MAVKIAFANLKGGVGKTVSTLSVASILGERGYRTLLIDCDPQCNSTITVGGKIDGVATLYDIFFSGATAADCIQKTTYAPNLSLIASDFQLASIDGRIQPSPNMYKYVRKALKSVEEKFDYILFDLPPFIGLLVGNIFACGDCGIVIPTECELYCVSGFHELSATIADYYEDNPGLEILGILKVKYKKNQKLTRDLENTILPERAAQMGTKVFNTAIRESVKCKEAIMMRRSLGDYAKNSTVYQDYSDFVDELLVEVGKRTWQ